MGPIELSPSLADRKRRACAGVVCLTAPMQVRQSSIRGDRPECPVDASHRVHGHARYERYSKVDGDEKESIPRWRCTSGCGTISVLPDGRLPYRPIGVDLLEGWLDALFDGGRGPPPVTEKEKGCLDRAVTRFHQRIPDLTVVLGQMIGVISPTASQLWMSIRKLGKLREILRLLAEDFKTSLLWTYRCLRPRGVSP